MRLKYSDHFVIVLIILTLIMLVMIGGCSSAPTILQTNTIDSVKVIRERSTEVVKVEPKMMPKKPQTVRVVVDSSGNQSATFTNCPPEPPRKFHGKTPRHEVEVDLDAGTVAITDNATDNDTSLHLRAGKVLDIQPEEPGFMEKVKGVLWPLAGILFMLLVGYAIIKKKLTVS